MSSSPLPTIIDDIIQLDQSQYDIDQDRIMLDGDGDDEEGDGEERVDREHVFMPVVQSLVAALGGFEEITDPTTGNLTTIYLPGDSALPVLRSLKRLWRKDDTDDERTVARCFAKTGLARELIALLGECAERGESGRKLALAAADLLAALTWPIDVSAELKELEDEPEVVTDYASLLKSQVEYKAMILRSSDTIRCLMVLMIPSLAKQNRNRTDKDRRIVSLILHLIRNLLSIRDPPSTLSSTSSGLELSRLQSELINQLEINGFLTLLLTLGGMAGKSEWNHVNVLVLDIMWSMYKGVRASDLIKDQAKAPIENLTKLLEEEDQYRRSNQRNGNSRHSRFGTTISIQSGGAKYVLHKQKAISASAASILDGNKRQRATNIKRQDDGFMAAASELSVEALEILQAFAVKFIDSCFNAFFESILKDIRMSRSKIRETDNLRTLYLTRFFVEYFLLLRTKAISVADVEKAAREARRVAKGKQREMDPFAILLDPQAEGPNDVTTEVIDQSVDEVETYPFGLIGVMAQEDTIRWMQRRLTTSIDGKIAWVELQACMSSIAHLLSLTESMASDSDDDIKEAAAVVKDKVFYDATTLESAVTILKQCHDRPVACQEIVIDFAFVLLRTLEKYSQSQEYIHVRKKKNRRRQKHAMTDAEQAEFDEEEAALEDSMPSYQEHRRTFRQFEEKYINEEVAKVLVVHADHYKDFADADHLKRLVGLMHRIGVKRQAEGVFFKVSILRIFKRLLDDKTSISKLPGSKDLLAFINYILRKFFKAAKAKPMLFVEVFFPLTKSVWKEHSTYQSDEDSALEDDLARIRANRTKIPAELEFKPDRKLSWSEQMGVAVRCLLDEGKMNLITWLLEIIALVAASRQEIILHTDGEPRIYDPDLDDERPPTGPSVEAKEKIEDHAIDFDSDDRAHAATYDPHFRLMLKLVSFDSKDSEAVDVPEDVNAPLLAWYVPRGVLPDSLEASTRVIEQFLRDPFDLDGENAQDMLRKKRKQSNRCRRSPDLDEGGAIVRRQPKQTEVQHFKSAAFIEDSDDDEEADRIFFAREAQKREANRYAIGMASMNPHGKKKSKKGQEPVFTQELALSMQNDTPDDSDGEITMGRTPSPSQPNSTTEGTPAPSRKPRKRQRRADPDSDAESSDAEVIQPDAVDQSTARTRKRRVYGSQTDAESE